MGAGAAIGAAVVSGAASVAVGYAVDHVLGDGNYTQREFATDAALGIAGVGVAKSGAKVGVGIYAMRHGGKVRAAGRVDDAQDLHLAGRTLYREGMAEGAGTIIVVEAVDAAMSYYERENAISITKPTAITPFVVVPNTTSLSADLRRAKNGRFGKARCTATYRGKRCIRTWPHPGKHIYV